MNTDDDVCETCTFWQRVGRYLLLRLKEPTSWAAIFTTLTGLGVYIAPEKQTAISLIGTQIVALFLFAAREGRNKPDNPTLGTTISGQMPPAKPAIVPPGSTEDMPTIPTPKRLPVDAAGEIQAPQK